LTSVSGKKAATMKLFKILIPILIFIFAFNLYAQTKEELFAKTLDDKRKVIFQDRVLAENKTLQQLVDELGVPSTTIARWEKKIRQAYDAYLETGEVSNKYLLIDQKTLNDFADYVLKKPEEKYLFTFRIASNDPETLDAIAKKFEIPPITMARREAKVIEKLEKYLKNPSEFLITPYEAEKLAAANETFAKTLNDQEKIIFEERIIADDPLTIDQLAVKLDVPANTISRWGQKIRKDYDAYLKTGEVPNKYVLVDQETLSKFSDDVLKTPAEEYILSLRTSNSNPLTLEQIAKKLKINPATVLKKEQKIKGKLDEYLEDQINQKVEALLQQSEKINFDAETIAMFKEYIKNAELKGETTKAQLANVALGNTVTVEPVVSDISYISAPTELEYNEAKFTDNMATYLENGNLMYKDYFLKQTPEKLAHLAITRMVKYMDKLDADDFKALALSNGVLSYLEYRINSLPSGSKTRMVYTFALETFTNLVKAEDPSFLFKSCNIKMQDLENIKTRVELLVAEEMKEPYYKENFSFNKDSERYEKLGELKESTFKL